MSRGTRRHTPLILTLVVLVVAACAALFGYPIVKEYLDNKELNAQKAALSAQLDTLNGQNEALQNEIEDTKTDSFVERMAHELLGWVKKGEIKIVDKNK